MKGKKLSKLINSILSGLYPRYAKILEKRYGLKDGQPRSLEEIGKEEGITRERVRQIIENGQKKIEGSFNNPSFLDWQEYINWAKNHLSLWGGIRKEDLFLDEIKNHFFHQEKERFLEKKIKFLLISSQKIFFQPKSQERESFFYLNQEAKERLEKILFSFYKKIENSGGIVDSQKFSKIITSLAQKNSLSESTICSYLSLDKRIGINILGEIGFKENNFIKPRNIRDQVYLVFRQLKTPLHFKELHQLIREKNLWPRQISLHTVHNELIRDPRFVLVGRGTYALKEWGYQGGTTKDILLTILEKSKKPLSFEEIKKQLDKQFISKKSTILLNLQRMPQVKKLPNGKYILKKKIKVLKA